MLKSKASAAMILMELLPFVDNSKIMLHETSLNFSLKHYNTAIN